MTKPIPLLTLSLVALASSTAAAEVPETAEALWADFADFDQRTPLDTEILRTWEDGDVVMHVVRFTVGEFGGETLKLAGYYSYPKGGRNLPALVQCNGGGQKAGTYGPLKWARNGYACFNPNNGAQPWDGDARGLPNTDWGRFNPGIRKPDRRSGPGTLAPGTGTVDDVVSPRNHQWYLRMVGMRRALTFLQSRPEVDPEKLGVRGHSTGGVMTVYTSVDPRVKAAVPSVGGSGFWWDDYPYLVGNQRGTEGMDEAHQKLFLDAISCDAHWKIMSCPILFLGSTNDFNSPTDNVVRALAAVPHDRKRLVLAPHYNHSFDPATAIADALWFEDHLKGTFRFPETPESKLILETSDGIPRFVVKPDPDSELPIASVDIFYGYDRQPQVRFWADAGATEKDGEWEGRCPVFHADEPLFAFANITYEINPDLPAPQTTGTRQLTVTSTYRFATPEQLTAAGVRPTEKPRRLIDDFSRGLHDWTGNLEKGRGWFIETRKLVDPRWVGPRGGALTFEVNVPSAKSWLGVQIQRRFKGQNNSEFNYYAYVEIPEAGWNTVRLEPDQFENIYGEKLDDWHKVITLSFRDAESLARDHQGRIPRAGGKSAGAGAPAIPSDVSNWDSAYYQSTDAAYAKDNVEGKSGDVTKRFRNLRWEGGEFMARPKHWEEG